MTDVSQGYYEKFVFTRRDGGSLPGRKHDGCEYFVLDLTHDPHAVPALRAYAEACYITHPRLSDDLRRRLSAIRLAEGDVR